MIDGALQQSNPVLFVFVGETAAYAPELKAFLHAHRIAAADCVIAPGENTAHLRPEINRIQQEFLLHRYNSVGLVRINFILHNAALLLPLRECVNEILSPLYPSGLMTDIYWLADESGTMEKDANDRAVTMQILHEGLEDAQIYLLSNLDSDSRYVKWNEVLHTITLLTLFKDCEPPEYVASPDASRYNEHLFNRNTDREHGVFYTAGSARLQVPPQALKALLMTALLKPLPLSAPAAPPINFPTVKAHKYDEEYLHALALPPEAAQIITDKMRTGIILQRLFGTRLDWVNDQHPPAATEVSKDELEQLLDGFGLFEALEIAQITWAAAIEAEISENKDLLTEEKEYLEEWLDKVQSLRALKNDRRELAFYYKPTQYPHTLAGEYLKRKAKISALQKRGNMLHTLQNSLNEIIAHLQTRCEAVEDVRAAYEADAQSISIADTPLKSALEYFEQLFTRHARKNAEALRTLTLPLRTEIPITELDEYIDTKLMRDPDFARSFTEMLAHLADDTALTAWAAAARRTHIRLRTNAQALHTETNLHAAPKWAANVKTAFEAQGHGRMNLFADPLASRVSVLYHAGAFSLKDIYYADLYR
jgi:hypothetical protein